MEDKGNTIEKLWIWIMLFIVCLSGTLIFAKSSLDPDNYNYAVEEIHEYDKSVYASNISIEGSEYSPRLFANRFMAFLMRIKHGNWNDAALLLIRSNYLLYAVAIAFISIKLFQTYDLLQVLFLATITMSGALISLAFEMNDAQDVFLGTAIPFALLAIACTIGERQDWNAAWLFLTVSELMHVHEGIWGGCIVGLIWLGVVLDERKIRWNTLLLLPVYLLSVALVVSPSLKHAVEVDEALFTQVYAVIRTPHHLLVSSWGPGKVITAGFMIAGAVFVSGREVQHGGVIKKHTFYAMILMFAFWLLVLLIEYHAVELQPNSTIVTMYLPKALKYITYIAALTYLKLGFVYISRRCYIRGACLLLIVTTPYSGFLSVSATHCQLLFYILIVIYGISDSLDLETRLFSSTIGWQREKQAVRLVCAVLLLGKCLLQYGLIKTGKVFAVLVFISLCVSLQRVIKQKHISKAVLVFLGIMILVYNAEALFYVRSGYRLEYLSGDEYAARSVGDNVYDLAKDFERVSDKNSVYLAEPYDREANGFQLISKRSCYRLYKNMPSNKANVILWYQDIQMLKGLQEKSVDEIIDIMTERKIDYILISEKKMEELSNNSKFEEIVKNKALGVYKLK